MTSSRPQFSRVGALLSLLLFAANAQAQTLSSTSVTPDQNTVGTVFDTQGLAAAPGSTLEADYNRVLSGTAAQAAQSSQSMLPTTGYNLPGAASALVNAEDNAVSGRLRTLREGSRLAPHRIASAPRSGPFTDLQASNDTLHDLRAQVPQPTSKHSTQDNYRFNNPAVYRDPVAQPHPDTAVEDGYNEMMRKASIGTGAANATTRDVPAKRQRIILNQADRAGRDLLNWAGELGGSGKTFDSAKGPMPRYAKEVDKKHLREATSYRGQPLSSFTRVPTQPTTQPLPPESTSNVPPPMIQSRDSAAQLPAFDKTSQATSSQRFQQTPRNAMIIDTRDSFQSAPQSEDTVQENPPEEPHAAPSPPPQTRPAYGTTAIPFREGAAINTDRRWGYFVTGAPGYGNGEYQTTSSKARTTHAGFTAGVDYRLEDQSFVGMALTYAHSNFSTASLGELSGNSVAVSLYGTTDYAKNAYAMGYLSLGYHSLESDRTVLAGAGTTRKASASPDGFQFSAKAETGYDLYQDQLKYGPYAGFRVASASFGSFTESGAGNFNLKVKSVNDLSAISTLGFGGSMPFAMTGGGVFLPSLRLGYNHEFGDDQTNIRAEFANLSGSSFTTKGAKKSRDWVNITPALTATLPNDWTFAAQYEHDFFRDNSRENIFNLTAAYKW